VVATDRDVADWWRPAEGLAWTAAGAEVEVWPIGSASWQMPPTVLLRHVRKRSPDIVVVAADEPLRRTLAARAITTLIRGVTCPVLVSRPSPSTGRVLVAADFGRAVLPALGSEPPGRRSGGRLRLLPALADVACVIERAPQPDDITHINEARLGRLLALVGLRGELSAVQQAPDDTLLEAVHSLGAELAVVSARRRRGLWGRLRESVAETAAFDAPCSVLVVQETAVGGGG
jgi:nucleotide-binding universal stress UspA family protein